MLGGGGIFRELLKAIDEESGVVGVSQGGEGLQCVEGSGCDGGQLVIVERQQADVVQPREAVVVDAADLVVPQHPEKPARRNLELRVNPKSCDCTSRHIG